MVIDFKKTGVKGKVTFSTFGCNVFQESPATPDKIRPDVVIERAVHTDGRWNTPDGKRVRYWGFADPLSPIAADRVAPYPSPLIRVRQGQVVHTKLKSKKNAHTIHHHGIEPTTFNDGVGHVSFEVQTEYSYQWQPAHPGTFFYHCHRNTVLHFEMGMFGMLIVDPPEGPGTLYSGGPTYQVERIWVADDVDPRWHIPNEHDAGLCGEDAGLNRFEPKYFLISGVFNNKTMLDSRVAVEAKLGDRILIRLLNASYSILRLTLGVDALLVSVDGRQLGAEPWNSPKLFPAGSRIELTTASRFDLLITPTQRGVFGVKFEFLHWITGKVQADGAGIAQTRIIVK
ncbi:copper oxidase [Sphingomonas oleivorans]|uniref:Copper oxidase n=1 Tax=Sphingomonas oleivorans TaxID=1735121 RepID=A0A2T5FY03_9SPHN|nr:multicopper oxidase domain-containing protein [Sphingomonas oleivorans]PTQ11420.1 copper oxidase [Sphingomonas oleivorans]